MKPTQTVEALLRPVVTGMGYELDEVEFQKEQGNWVLTLYIEHQDGRSATIDDCEAVSRVVSDLLDEADPIEGSYTFEVSSAGAERPLKRASDFARFLGSPVTVRLYKNRDGRKEFAGDLAGYEDGAVLLKVGEETLRFEKGDVALVRLRVDF